MIEFYALAQQCAPNLEKEVVASIARTESSFNPFAIGVVDGSIRQPTNLNEAIRAVRKLKSQGKNYSVGLMQVNKVNFNHYNLNESNMFDPCTNIRVGASIFNNCFKRANATFGQKYSYDGKLRLAMSCYYSGNFKTGFRADFVGQPPYVTKVFNHLIGYRNSQSPLPVPRQLPLPVPPSKIQPIIAQQALPQDGLALADYAESLQVKAVSSDIPVNDLAEAKLVKKSQEDVQPKVFNGDVFTQPLTDVFNSI